MVLVLSVLAVEQMDCVALYSASIVAPITSQFQRNAGLFIALNFLIAAELQRHSVTTVSVVALRLTPGEYFFHHFLQCFHSVVATNGRNGPPSAMITSA